MAMMGTPHGVRDNPPPTTPVPPPDEDSSDILLICTEPPRYAQYVWEENGSDSGVKSHKMILETPMNGEQACRPSPDTTTMYNGGQWRSDIRTTELKPRKLEFGKEDTMDTLVSCCTIHTSKQVMASNSMRRQEVNVQDIVLGGEIREYASGSVEFLELFAKTNPLEAIKSSATVHHSFPSTILEQLEAIHGERGDVPHPIQKKRVNLWTYNKTLLQGKEYNCKLSIVESFNDMKMFALLFVKFQCPSFNEIQCLDSVEQAYCELVDKWLRDTNEQDGLVLDLADRLRSFAQSSVRRRMNTVLRQARLWPNLTHHKFQFNTLEKTPEHGEARERQQPLDILKAAIIKNAIDQHEQHKARESPICESLVDAIRPDKIAEAVERHQRGLEGRPEPTTAEHT